MSSKIQKFNEKFYGLFGIRDSIYLLKCISFSNWMLLLFGCLLAICTGTGLPHLVGIVGWILNIYIFMNPQSTEYSASITPLLLYYCAMALMLSIIAFFQYACFNYVAISVSRRLRRKFFKAILRENKVECQSFISDIQILATVITETLPAIFTAIVQLVASGVISYTLTWRLSWLISALAVGCGIWVAILQKLIQMESINETKLCSQLAQSPENMQILLQKQRFSGIRKGILQGTLTGSLQLFPYLGWGTAAIYGNWLIDRNLVKLPAYIYVVVSTLIPACVKIGQLPIILPTFTVLPRLGRIMKSAKQDIEKSTTEKINVEKMGTKKDLLIMFVKSEIEILPEELSDHSSPTFRNVRRNAFSHWFLYGIAFLCCGMIGAASAALTKLNGNMFEFYNKPNIRIFFEKGARIALDYLIVGVTTFICGVVSGGIFGFNSETAIKKFRHLIFDNTKLQPTSITNFSKQTNVVKMAFDNHLAVFLIAILAIVCAILSNVHKSLTFTFLTAVAFTLQVVAQIFVIRFAEISVQNSNEASHQKGIEVLQKFQNFEPEDIDAHHDEIRNLHNSYLTFCFRKQYSTIFAKALRFSFIFAVPQITQAITYAMGSYMIINRTLTPVSVYKIVQTVYNAIGGVAIIAQYPHDVYASQLAAQKIDETLVLEKIVINPKKSSSNISTATTVIL